MWFSANDLKGLEKIKRINLINGIGGIKPANLIGTRGSNGNTNLAVFNSIVHIGAKPPLIGFILRPHQEVSRHTYENILETNEYTINHLPTSLVRSGHYTSAKFPPKVSEFDSCGFSHMYHDNFLAPAVAESPIQVGLKYRESIPIAINQTTLVIGEIQWVHLVDGLLTPEYHINLEASKSAGVGGLNTYYQLQSINTFPYARPEDFTSKS